MILHREFLPQELIIHFKAMDAAIMDLSDKRKDYIRLRHLYKKLLKIDTIVDIYDDPGEKFIDTM